MHPYLTLNECEKRALGFLRLTEAERGVKNVTECREPAVRDGAEESVKASEPEGRISETLANLLPFERFDGCPVMTVSNGAIQHKSKNSILLLDDLPGVVRDNTGIRLMTDQ